MRVNLNMPTGTTLLLIDEDAAYALLRDRAMQQAMRIADVARMIIDPTEILTEASDGKS